MICYAVYYSAAKFPIEQPSNKAAKCVIRQSWKLKVKPNLRRKLWGHPLTPSMTSSPWFFLGIIWDDRFIFEVKLKLCLIFQNGRHMELATNFFYRKWNQKLNMPKRKPLVFPTSWAFDRSSSSNIDGDIAISKFDLLSDLMTSPMTSWVRET